jgi:folylpolyglutamate synthase/dihydropteroate synthase
VELARGASAGGRSRIVVTGSLYLVGELRSRLLGLDCDPIVPL